MTFKVLGQARPPSSTPASLYSPPASTETIISMVKCANVTTSGVGIRVFLDDDGSTFDETTALHWDVRVNAGETFEVTGPITMNDPAGNLAVSGDANSITYTVFGSEVSSL